MRWRRCGASTPRAPPPEPQAPRHERLREGLSLKLHIVAHGRIGRGPEAEIVARYLKRITWPTAITELADTAPTPPAPPGTRTVVLDERGRGLTSRQLADALARFRDDGARETRFLLGPADGHGDAVRASADLLLSFGALTWPHLLARAMLAEQLYRATSLLAGHPYHRD